MIRFEHIEHLYALLVLLPLTLFFALYLIRRNKVLKLLGNKPLVDKISPTKSTAHHVVKYLLFAFAYVSLVIAWANPQIGTKYEQVKREGLDVFIALDVSKSMLAEDVVPNRMIKAKQLVSNLMDELHQDRIGLIVFAGNAYLQMPLTVDHYAGKMYLKNIDTDLMPTQGTAIADAVNLASKSFNQEEDKHKALIVISDGENHEGDAMQAIEDALDQGIKVYTVGVGSTSGAPIPVSNSGEMKKDASGNVVLTKLNEEMLQKMANVGGGGYYNIQSKNISSEIVSSISGLEGKLLEEKVISDYKDQFPIFLIIAFVFLILELIISERKRKIFGKWAV